MNNSLHPNSCRIWQIPARWLVLLFALLALLPGARANVIQANNTYPPPNGSFRAPGPDWNFGSGGSAVQFKDVAFTFFDNFTLIGNPGGLVTFNAQFSHKVSLNGGATWSGEQAATAAFTITLGPVSGNDHSFTINSLTISGGDLPASFQLRKLAVVGSPLVTFTPSGGNVDITSTFYLSLELSQDSGATWAASSTSGSFGTPAFVLAPLSNEEVTSSPTLPPGDGQYYDANAYHSAFANGIVIRNPLHNGFLGQTCTDTNGQAGTAPLTNSLCPPPLLGDTQTEDFTSKMRFDIEMPGLIHVGPIGATVQTRVQHSHDSGVLQIFRTKMLQLNPNPGTLPAGMNFRINPDPNKPSLGVTTLRPGPTPDTTNISSSFALRLQMTTDGGATWQDADQFTRMQLQILPTLTVSNQVVAGFNLLALQLDNTNGLNAIQTPEDGDQIYLWDVLAQDFSGTIATYVTGFGWDQQITLAPGQAFFYVTMTPRTLTYTGTPHIPVLPLTLTPNVYHALGRQTNGVGTYENITGTAPGAGSQFNLWDPVFQDWTTNSFNGVAWSGGTPSVPPGKGVFIRPVPPTGAPVITSRPRSQSLVVGSNALFQVAVTAAPPAALQWFKDGVALPGATGSALLLPSVTSSNAGYYHVVASNEIGVVASSPAVLRIQNVPNPGGDPNGPTDLDFGDLPAPYAACWRYASYGPYGVDGSTCLPITYSTIKMGVTTPLTYPTLLQDNGARHYFMRDFIWLGSDVSATLNGTPHSGARFDPTSANGGLDTSTAGVRKEENGIRIIPPPFVPNTQIAIGQNYLADPRFTPSGLLGFNLFGRIISNPALNYRTCYSPGQTVWFTVEAYNPLSEPKYCQPFYLNAWIDYGDATGPNGAPDALFQNNAEYVIQDAPLWGEAMLQELAYQTSYPYDSSDATLRTNILTAWGCENAALPNIGVQPHADKGLQVFSFTIPDMPNLDKCGKRAFARFRITRQPMGLGVGGSNPYGLTDPATGLVNDGGEVEDYPIFITKSCSSGFPGSSWLCMKPISQATTFVGKPVFPCYNCPSCVADYGPLPAPELTGFSTSTTGTDCQYSLLPSLGGWCGTGLAPFVGLVANTGASNLTGVTVTYPISTNAEFYAACSSQGTWVRQSNVVVFSLGTLEAGEQAEISLSYAARASGLMNHEFQLAADQPLLNPEDAVVTVPNPVTVQEAPVETNYTININQGLNLIANQLDHGSNTLAEVLPAVPAGSVLYKYENATHQWRVAVFDEFDLVWQPADITLSPGEGAFLRSPVSTTLTFHGNPHVPVLPVALPPNQLYLLSRQTNAPGTPEQIVGGDVPPGTTAYMYSGGAYTMFTFDEFDLLWTPSTPIAAVGGSMWIGSGAPPLLPPDPLRILCLSNKAVFLSNSNWTFDTPGTAGGCSNGTVSVQSTVTNSYCPLVVTRTWQATDICSNSVTCSQTVTVINDLFHFQCPSNIVTYLNGSNTIPVSFAPTLSGGTLLGCYPSSGSPFPLGVTTVTCYAWDGCQSNVCSFAVTVLSNAPCISYSGLVNCPLGSGLLTLQSNLLLVSNIGTSGLDGVSIDLGQAMSFDVGLATMLPPVGATIKFNARGSVGGAPNQPLGHVSVMRENSNQDGYRISGDLSDIGISTVRLEVWSNNVLVALFPGHPAGALARASTWPLGNGKIGPTNGWPTGPTGPVGPIYGCYPVAFPDDTVFWVGNSNYVANELRILQEGGTGVDYLSEFSITAANCPDLTIINERVSHFPVSYSGRLHIPGGNASLEVAAGSLIITNLGTNGQDGVSISLGRAVSCNILLATQAPPVGAWMEFAAYGSVNGQTNHTLGFTRVTRLNANLDGYEIRGDLSDTASTIQLELWNNGGLTQVFPNRTNGVLARASTWPNGTGKLGPITSDPVGPIYGCFPIDFDQSTDVWVDGIIYQADQVRVLQEGGAGVDYLSHFTITSGNLEGFAITSESVLPLARRLRSTWSGNQLQLQWNGPGALQFSTDLMHWTNMPAATSPFPVPVTGSMKFYRTAQ